MEKEKSGLDTSDLVVMSFGTSQKKHVSMIDTLDSSFKHTFWGLGRGSRNIPSQATDHSLATNSPDRPRIIGCADDEHSGIIFANMLTI